MKRRNFLRLSAGVPFILKTPLYEGDIQGSKDSFSLPEDQLFLKVKQGPEVRYNWSRRKVVNIGSLQDFSPQTSEDLSVFGGDKSYNLGGTGFFRTEKKNDRWWLVDPEGYPFISSGFNSVKVPEGMEEKIISILRETGTSTLGCWSEYEKLREVRDPLPYSVSLGFIKEFMRNQPKKENHGRGWKRRFPNLTLSVFHPEFEEFADKYAREKTAETKNDPYCLGYYSDNELPFVFDSLDRYLEMPDEDFGHKTAKKWLIKRGIKSREQITYTDRMDFLELMTEKYFSICGKSLKKYDPDHLYLGSRLHGYDNSLLKSTTSRPVFKAAGRYVDVVSMNLYGTIGPDAPELSRFSKWAGKPIYITEFYAKGMDSGLENNEGAGRIVPTQKDRGNFFQNFTLKLLKSTGCVGWDWHRYIDPETSNKGLVNKDHEVYRDFQQKVKQLNEQRYALIKYFHKAENRTSIQKSEQSFQLYRNGVPFDIKGQIGLKDIDRLMDAQGNAVKIYSDYSYDLDYIRSKGIAVLLTMDLKKFTEAVIHNDRAKKQQEKEKILSIVDNLRSHKAILMWGLGDNIEFNHTRAKMKLYFKELNILMRMVKDLDPDHPVITSLSAGGTEYLPDIAKIVSHIDAIGFNTTNQESFERIPEIITKAAWKKPYIVTDFNYSFDSDILKAPYDIPTWVESDGCSVLEDTYRKVVMQSPQCLGAFMLT